MSMTREEILAERARIDAEKEATTGEAADRARLAKELEQGVEETRTFLERAMSGNTFGLTDFIQRAGAAALDKFADGEEMSFADLMRRRGEEMRGRIERNPGNALAGELIGTMVRGGGLRAAQSLPGRLAQGAAIGAAESAGQEALGARETGSLLDQASNIALGGAFGLGGQALGEVVQRGGKSLIESLFPDAFDKGAREAGRSLMSPEGHVVNTALGGQPMTKEGIMDIATRGGGDMVADQDPALRRVLTGTAGSLDAAPQGATAEAIARARQAEIPSEAEDLVTRTFAPFGRPRTRTQTAATTDAQAAKASERFAEIFDTPAGRTNPVIQKTQLQNRLGAIDDTDPLEIQRIKGQISEMVDAMQGESEELSARGLQSLKISLDARINKGLKSTGDDALTGREVRELVAAKQAINDVMTSRISGYASAAEEFGKVRRNASVIEDGFNMFSKPRFSADETKAYYDALPKSEKIAFQTGITQAMMDRAVRSGEINYLKRLAGTKTTPEAAKLRAIFGGGKRFDKFIDEANELAERSKEANLLVSARERMQRTPEQPAPNVFSTSADVGNVAQKTATGQPASASFIASLRRLAFGNPAPTNRALTEFLQSQSGSPEALSLAEEIIRAQSRPAAGMLGGATGAGVGSGYQTIME